MRHTAQSVYNLDIPDHIQIIAAHITMSKIGDLAIIIIAIHNRDLGDVFVLITILFILLMDTHARLIRSHYAWFSNLSFHHASYSFSFYHLIMCQCSICSWKNKINKLFFVGFSYHDHTPPPPPPRYESVSGRSDKGAYSSDARLVWWQPQTLQQVCYQTALAKWAANWFQLIKTVDSFQPSILPNFHVNLWSDHAIFHSPTSGKSYRHGE